MRLEKLGRFDGIGDLVHEKLFDLGLIIRVCIVWYDFCRLVKGEDHCFDLIKNCALANTS